VDLERQLRGPNQELRLPSMVEVQNRCGKHHLVLSEAFYFFADRSFSYGTTVGIPIAFFCGGFVYNLYDIQNSLGNNDTAHALAFGMW
jgi:hypothetical protein